MSWRKNKKELTPAPPQCHHVWKDFDWYIETTYDDFMERVTVEVIEPYVCICCKARKNITLEKHVSDADTMRAAILKSSGFVDDLKRDYSAHIKPRAIVEDEINDFQLVDRRMLEIAKNA